MEQFGGTLAEVGWFCHDRAWNTWHWSEELFRIHGYAPGEVQPTEELVLGHKHPDDRGIVVAAWERALAGDRPVSCSHRLVTRDGDLRSVVSVLRSEAGPDGSRQYLHGLLTDLTDVRVAETRAVADGAVTSATESRAVIEQAKGALMLTYGIGADAAFNVLRRHSQHRNMRLAEVAETFVAGFADSGPGGSAAAGARRRRRPPPRRTAP